MTDLSDLSPQIARFNSYFNSGATASAYAVFLELAENFLRDHLYPIALANGSPPRYLVHYTSLDTLFSMLDPHKPGHLRLYDTLHANDPTEGTFFSDALQRSARSLFSRLPPLLLYPHPGHAYISSLIRADTLAVADKLAYWVAYGRNGSGCSIAIPYSPFSPNLPILPVQYGAAGVTRAAQQILSFLATLSPRFRRQLHSSTASTSAPSIRNLFTSIPYFHKPAGYRHEKECRIFLSALDPAQNPIFELRQTATGAPAVRHYVNHDALRPDRILYTGTVITLGPSIAKRKNVQSAIQSLLRDSGLRGPTVACSKIPYKPQPN